MDHICDEAGGVAAVRQALAVAIAGDVVTLGRGRFALREPLTVPSGVTLQGAGPDTMLEHSHDGPAVQVLSAEGVTLKNFAVASAAKDVRLRRLPDDPPGLENTDHFWSEWGLVWINSSYDCTIANLTLTGSNGNKNFSGVCARQSTQVSVRNCQISGFHYWGLALVSTTEGLISRNDISRNHSGIALHCSSETKSPSSARINDNRCHKNRTSGIILFSSNSQEIAGNNCWSNGKSGIFLERDPRVPDRPSRASISGNECHENAESGITLLSSESAEISDNKSWGNESSGIVLKLDAKSRGQPCRAAISGNQCYDNKETGIAILSSEASEVSGNACSKNGLHGILLSWDLQATDQPSRARLMNNRCNENKKSGIVLLSSHSPEISGNECHGNGVNGIALERRSQNPDQPSSAVIMGNKCHKNIKSGIILNSSDSLDISGNYCWENGESGIFLERSSGTQAGAPHAPISDNKCHENGTTGISLCSSESSSISGNECWGNALSGIVLKRCEIAHGKPSRAPILGNRCYDNKEAGILLIYSESMEIAENECWRNGKSGITLQPGVKEPDQPSRATVLRNRCYENGYAGIVLLSSESDEISRNNCWSNAKSGILLECHEGTVDQLSNATISYNRCYENLEAGIKLRSSMSPEISENDCWGNAQSGIALERDANALGYPSRATISGNLCHENQGSGIRLLSSEGEGISGNNCWGNEGSGISLMRDPKSPRQPSRSSILDNLCHGNEHTGINLLSSSARLSGNCVWDNESAGLRCGPEDLFAPPCEVIIEENWFLHNRWPICLERSTEWGALANRVSGNAEPGSFMNPAGTILGTLDWDPIELRESLEQTEARLRPRMPWGVLAGKLAAEGVERPDLLARFCHGGGAMGDLKAWLGIADPIIRPAPVMPNAEARPAYRFVRIGMSPQGDRLMHFAPNGCSGLSATFWKAVDRHVLRSEPSTCVIGLCGDFGADIKNLLSETQRLNGFDADGVTADNPLPSGSFERVRAFGVGGHRIGQVIVQDMSARNELALSQSRSDFGLLEPAAVTGWAGWLARLAYILRSPAIWVRPALVLLIGFLLSVVWAWLDGYPRPLSDPLGAFWHAVMVSILDFKVLDVWGILFKLGTLATLLAVFAQQFNAQMPRHLAVLPPRSISELSKRFKREAIARWVGRETDSVPIPWQRWIKQRLFRQRADIAVVLLRNVQEWTDADLASFDNLLHMRPAGKSLIVLIETPTRAIVDRAVLRPVLGKDPAMRKDVVLDICLGEEPGPLRLDRGKKAELLASLLGVDTQHVSRHCLEIRAPAFDLSDLIPLQAIGSNQHLPFIVSRPIGALFAIFGPELQRQVSRIAQIYCAEPDLQIDLSNDSAALTDWLERARLSTATVVLERTVSSGPSIDVLGRFQKRQNMTDALQEVFDEPNEALRLDYVHRALACAERHAVDRFISACSATPPRLPEALTSLRSALYARVERLRIQTDLAEPKQAEQRKRAAMLDEDVALAKKALHAVRIDAATASVSFLARLEALALIWEPDPSAALASSLSEPSMSQLKVWFEEILRAFSDTDRDFALSQTLYRIRPLISPLPKALQQRFIELSEQRQREGRSLAQLIADAKSTDDLLRLINSHRSIGRVVRCTVLRVLAQAAITAEQAELLAKSLIKNKDTFSVELAGAFPRGNSSTLALGFEPLLAEMDYVATSSESDGESPEQTVSDQDLIHGTLSSLFKTAKFLDLVLFEMAA